MFCIQYGRFFIQVFLGPKVEKFQKIIDPMESINSHIDRVIGVFVEILFSLFGVWTEMGAWHERNLILAGQKWNLGRTKLGSLKLGRR